MTKRILFRKSWAKAFTYTYYMPNKHGMCKCIEVDSTNKRVVNVREVSIKDVAEDVERLVGSIITFGCNWSCSIYMCHKFDKIMSEWV